MNPWIISGWMVVLFLGLVLGSLSVAMVVGLIRGLVVRKVEKTMSSFPDTSGRESP